MEPQTCTNFVFAELLSRILTNSTTFDLISHRLVSRQWKEEATQVLLKRGSLKITFQLDKKRYLQNKTNPTFCALKYPTLFLCDKHFKLRREEMGEDFLVDRTLSTLFRVVTNGPSPNEISSSLPVGHFDFCFKSSDLDRNQPQLISFLQVYGSKVRTLTLDNWIEYFVGFKGMTNFLLQYTPNLEKLRIEEGHVSNHEIPPEFTMKTNKSIATSGCPPVTLPHLKILEIDRRQLDCTTNCLEACKPTFQLLPHLLKIAPRLGQVYFHSFHSTNFELKIVNVFPPSKIHLLQIESLFLSSRDMFSSDLEVLEDFVEAMGKSPQGFCIKYINISVNFDLDTQDRWTKGCAALRQIFQANVNSLEHIDLEQGAALTLPKIQSLPTLCNVKSMSVTFDWFDVLLNTAVFESISTTYRDNSVSKLLPNLTTFRVVVRDCWAQESVRKWFPFWGDRLMTVKTLCFDSRDDGVKGSQAMAFSLNLCPEVTKFEGFWPYCQFPLLLLPLWNLTQLTSLQLSLSQNTVGIDDTFLDLDAGLTGLSKETVTAIYNNWERSGQWETPKRCRVDDTVEGKQNWQVPRANSSILDLLNLRELYLIFDFNHDYEPRILVSAVSAKFGFGLMKNLKVSIWLHVFKGKSFCPKCDCKSSKDTWRRLHEPLTSFSNVTLCNFY